MLNWTKILQKSSPSTRKILLHARSTHEELRRLLLDQQHLTPKLNFPAYSKVLPAKVVAEAEERVKNWKSSVKDTTAEIAALQSERDTKASQQLKHLKC